MLILSFWKISRSQKNDLIGYWVLNKHFVYDTINQKACGLKNENLKIDK